MNSLPEAKNSRTVRRVEMEHDRAAATAASKNPTSHSPQKHERRSRFF
jgi:hypothetical protein